MNKRRSCRYFSDTDIDPKIIENLILTTGTAQVEHTNNPGPLLLLIIKIKP